MMITTNTWKMQDKDMRTFLLLLSIVQIKGVIGKKMNHPEYTCMIENMRDVLTWSPCLFPNL